MFLALGATHVSNHDFARQFEEGKGWRKLRVTDPSTLEHGKVVLLGEDPRVDPVSDAYPKDKKNICIIINSECETC